MRPRTLDEFVGQEHIVGPGRLLRRAIQKDQLSSIILSGPPGTGKTTLARVIANTTSCRFVTLNAVLAGVADIRAAIEDARKNRELYDRRTMLFVDEVHRWNKAQQDALLPWVENGTLLLIGATTENPFFEVNRALVSRSRVFQLKALDNAALKQIALAAMSDAERGYGLWKVSFEDGALEHLVETADGDARSLLGALELAVETSAPSWPAKPGSLIKVSMEAAEESIQKRAVLYDKDGDYHYDAASAFIKSLRGSDPDAALYWLARMIYAGEDPRFAFRRMLISACEDIGLADPNAIRIVESCAAGFDRIGMPEGQFLLSEAALYLATAPKSNSTMGFFDALASVQAESSEVPTHLKDASRDKHGFGHGEGYLYPHAYRDHWVAQQYLPDSLKGRIFYQPGALGLEGERRGTVLERREAQLASLYSAEEEDSILASEDEGSWSKSGESKREWRSRAEGSTPARLSAIRQALFERAKPGRSDRILVLDAREGYLVWEALRRSPEGTIAALTKTESEAGIIENYAQTLPEIERPLLACLPHESISVELLQKEFGFSSFDLVLGRDLFDADKARPGAVMQRLVEALPKARFSLIQTLPREGARLSALFAQALGDETKKLEAFEAAFYSGFGLGHGEIEEELAGLQSGKDGLAISCSLLATSYARQLSTKEAEAWFSPASAYGKALGAELGGEAQSLISGRISRAVGSLKSPIAWPLSLLHISIQSG